MHGADLPADRMPLAEAVFELKWTLRAGAVPGQPPSDPNYKLLVGSLFERIRGPYPFHENLPAASIPDEFVPQVVQHRFRRTEGGYPLIQLGPGVFAVNDTKGYSWRTFLPVVLAAVKELRAAYVGELQPEATVLRYIDAVPFDSHTDDAFAFMRDNLKVDVTLPPQLFFEDRASPRPNTVTLETSHTLGDPPGRVMLKFTTGEVAGIRHLVWETHVVSVGPDAPGLDALEGWLNAAHDVAREWFFVLIEGRLEDSLRT